MAAPPERFGPKIEQFSDIVDCGDFDASISGTVTTRYTVFTGHRGNVTGFKQFVSAPADTWVNLETGKSIVVRAHFVQTWDAATGNLTIGGFRYLVNERGEGVTVQEVGRIVYTDRTEQEIVSMAGTHELDSWDLIEPTLCSALL